MYWKLGWFAAASLSLASCGSGTNNSGPPPISGATVAPNAIVAAVGNTEADLQRSIQDANGAGRTPRFVRIHTARHDHVFSPYAQILRTQNAIIARGYGNIFVWKSDDATVYWSAAGARVNDQIPVVQAPKIDVIAMGLTGESAGKMVSWGGQRPRQHGDPWAGIKDPWQIHPDYTSVNPSPPIVQVAMSGGKRGKRYIQPACSIDMGCCNQIGNTFEGCYYYYYEYYYSPWGPGPRVGGGGGGGAGGAPPCAPTGMSQTLAKVFNNDLFLQALAQAIAAANGGTPPRVNDVATLPKGASPVVAIGDPQTRVLNWYDDEVSKALKLGYTMEGIFSHELDHFWYRNAPAAGGDFPNPVPSQASFIASPTVTLDGGTVIQFNLLNADGSINVTQYLGYEHILIHDDEVQQYGTDVLFASLADGMAAASSVTVPGGTAQKVDSATALKIIDQQGLKTKSIKDRKAKRPPTTPSTTGGCTKTSSHARIPLGVRTTRAQQENVGGYSVIWDGVIPPGP